MIRNITTFLFLLLILSCSRTVTETTVLPSVSIDEVEPVTFTLLYDQADSLLSIGDIKAADSVYQTVLTDSANVTQSDKAYIDYQYIIITLNGQKQQDYKYITDLITNFLDKYPNFRSQYRAQLLHGLIKNLSNHTKLLSRSTITIDSLMNENLEFEQNTTTLKKHISSLKQENYKLNNRIKLLEEVILELSGVEKKDTQKTE